MQRSFINILSSNVERSARFYEELLGMHRHFAADWFVIMSHHDIPGLEYGILQRDHEIVPAPLQAAPSGVIVTFVVADCDEVARKAEEIGAKVISPPTDMPYGQRRMLVEDPDGTAIDISAPTAPMQA